MTQKRKFLLREKRLLSHFMATFATVMFHSNTNVMFRRLSLFLFVAMAITRCLAQTDMPALRHVMDLHVAIGQNVSLGNTPQGTRNIIPITGGTFEGPDIRGTILGGGADYQLMSADKSRNALEAIYNIRTDDGIVIHIRNKGIVKGDYFFCAPTFEAPVESRYAWLNDAIFVCRPIGFASGEIHLRVWRVQDKP